MKMQYFINNKKVSYQEAVDQNKTKKNAFVRFDSFFVTDIPERYGIIAPYLPKHTNLTDKLVFIIEEDKHKMTARMKKKEFKFFLNLVFNHFSTDDIQVLDFFNNDWVLIGWYYWEFNVCGTADMDFFVTLWKKFFLEPSSTNNEEIDIIKNINETFDMKALIGDLNLTYKWVLIDKYLIDFNHKITENNCWLPFFIASKNIEDKEKLIKYFQGYGYDYPDKAIEDFTIQINDRKKIIFYDNRIDLASEVEAKQTNKTLIETWIKPYWYIKTDYDFDKNKLMDRTQEFFLCKNLQSKEDVFVSKHIDRKDFNRVHHKYSWFAFRGSELDLLDLYRSFDILKNDWKLRDIDVVYYNWYDYEHNTFIHSWKEVNKKTADLIIVSQDYWILNNLNIDIYTAYKKFKKIYTEKFSSISFIWMCWALIRDIFKEYRFFIPTLLASAETEAGKSTFFERLMGIFGFDVNSSWVKARYLNLKWLTQQPLLTYWFDKVPLWLDELTQEVNPKVEETLRVFYDNWTTSKWTLWGNELYVANSPLIISGERFPKYKSVINRSIAMKFQKCDRISNKEDLYEITKFNCLQDYVTRVIWLEKRDIITAMETRRSEFIINWSERVNDSFKFIMITNSLFQLEEEEVLLNHLKEIRKEQEKILNFQDEDMVILIEILKRNMQYRMITAEEKSDWVIINLFISALDRRDVEENTRQILDLKRKYWYSKAIDNPNIITINLDELVKWWHKVLFNTVVEMLKKAPDMVIAHYVDKVTEAYKSFII